MKYIVLLSVGAAVLLSGCGSGGGNSPRHAIYAAQAGIGDFHDGYYDGFYGPFIDGYWGGDNFFYYNDLDGRWHRDEAHHFRHDAAEGFNHVRGSGQHLH